MDDTTELLDIPAFLRRTNTEEIANAKPLSIDNVLGAYKSEPPKVTVNLAECEVVLKSSNRSSGGVVMKFLVKPEDYTAVMAVLPLNEPMTLKLEKMEIGA